MAAKPAPTGACLLQMLTTDLQKNNAMPRASVAVAGTALCFLPMGLDKE